MRRKSRFLKRPHLNQVRSSALGIVRYVSRSLETLVISDAASDERFAGDSYIERHKPKSVLCASIMHQGKPVGILYLENNRIRNAFNKAHLMAVRIISSQAAVALENARLHFRVKTEIKIRQQAEDRARGKLSSMSPNLRIDWRPKTFICGKRSERSTISRR